VKSAGCGPHFLCPDTLRSAARAAVVGGFGQQIPDAKRKTSGQAILRKLTQGWFRRMGGRAHVDISSCETPAPLREKPQQTGAEKGFHAEKFLSVSWNDQRKCLIVRSKKIIRCLI
jgi:hypothetical protein